MSRFELITPRTLPEAIALLGDGDPEVRPYSGGTATMLMMKTGVFQPRVLVNLRGLDAAYGRIEAMPDGRLRIGALATLSALEHSAVASKHASIFPRMLKHLANVRVRNVARVGGALAHGDPHMDLPPVLACLGGEALLSGPEGERRVPVEGLYTGYYETVLHAAEVITAVEVPDQAGLTTVYLKMTTRSADDWPALGLAVALRCAEGVIQDCRLVVSAATETLRRLPGAERELIGRIADDAIFRRAGDAAAEETETMSDALGSAEYKTQLLRVQLRRALQQALVENRQP